MKIQSSRLKVFLSELSKVTLISVIVGAMFMLYLLTVGVPSTQARNLYLEAMTTKNIVVKKSLLEASLQTWYDPEVAAELTKL